MAGAMAPEQRSRVEQIATRFKQLYTAAVYDVLDSMGLANQCLHLEIKPLDRRMRLCGPAFTVFGGPDPRPKEEWPANQRIDNFALFGEIYPGCVVLVAAAGERQAGHWGELMSNGAKAKGAVGVVVDGGTRDGNLLLELDGWPVFTRYISPIESRRRYRTLDMQVPVAVSGSLTAQVRVNPGDWLFGDADGVIVIPAEILDEVLDKGESTKAIEDQVREDITRGVPVPEVYKRYGRF